VLECIDAGLVKERHRENIEPLGYLRAVATEELRSKQTARPRVAGRPNPELGRARVVVLVIPHDGFAREGSQTSLHGLTVAEARTPDDEVEDFHDLRSKAPLEHRVPSNRVLAGNAPLLVRRGAEWDVRWISEETVTRLDAVARSKDVRDIGLHARAHAQGTRTP